eukprot:TRINITY_DN3746_c0_g1_i1.p1 TRINITY_DN3746_c0_g1~~TRINITY_DN3746_c0_g1_i1.p1  ORF type:complete len:232 (-),score=18.77 TRINITY_DN3746_c0_g1_i1:90-785(-)
MKSGVNVEQHCVESGVPVWKTDCNPFNYADNKTPITKHQVEGVPGAFVLENVLTEEECKAYIEMTERFGYSRALLTIGKGKMIEDSSRTNYRSIWQTQDDVWKPIYDRVKDHLPQSITIYGRDWRFYGFNERFRFYRYDSDQTFFRHFDGCFPRNSHDKSILTFIVYLNDDFRGGCTTFYVRGKEIKVTPRQGMALVFEHGSSPRSPEHEGSTVSSGRKYVLRSDVMYNCK